MFSKMRRWQRFSIGFAIVLVVLVIGFLSVIQAAITWGATPEEVSAALPGDDIAPNAYVSWDNSVTIHAPVEQVWQWIIQMGDKRAGFYSYTFIEKAFMQVAGIKGDELKDYYNNADRIHPEWQKPALGEGLIMDTLTIKTYETNRDLVGATEKDDFRWNWSWHLQPIDSATTRLHVRTRLQVPANAQSPLVTFAFSAGGFVMEQNMIQGIRQRAEGEGEPANIETFEIIIWLAALAAGLACAATFVFGYGENKALLVGLTAVILIFVLTYVQPAVGLRVAIDLALWGATIWVITADRKAGSRQLINSDPS
jgi:hypothetical protein